MTSILEHPATSFPLLWLHPQSHSPLPPPSIPLSLSHLASPSTTARTSTSITDPNKREALFHILLRHPSHSCIHLRTFPAYPDRIGSHHLADARPATARIHDSPRYAESFF